MIGVPSAVRARVAHSRPFRVLLLGGSGFLGAPLARRLRASGLDVRIVDDRVMRDTVEHRFASSDPLDERRFFAEPERVLADCDALVHLRWRGIARSTPLDDVGENEHNVAPSRRVLRMAAGKAVVFASSAGALYGTASCLGSGARESDPTEPVRPYGRAKLRVERLVLEGATASAGGVVMRPANPYGPGQAADARVGVVGAFLARIASGRALTLYGSPEQERDFLYVDDLADAFARALGFALDGGCGVFNLGGGAPTRIGDLVRIVERTVGRRARLVRLPPRPGDRARVLVDTSRARDVLGWSPQFDLEEGIARTWHALAPERRTAYCGPRAPLPSIASARSVLPALFEPAPALAL